MDLGAVMQEVADQLDTIDGLRVHAYPQDSINPPAAVVAYPEEWVYDATMRRGMDRCLLPVVLLVGKATERTARDRLGIYVDGAGDKSVKTVLEAGTYTTLDSLRVQSCTFDVHVIGGIEYLAAIFTIDIAGPGGD